MGLGQRTFSREAEVAAACRRVSPPAAAAIMEPVADCRNRLRPRGPKFILKHELDACLERERRAAGRNLCDRAEAVHADSWHGGGCERRARESDWARYRASEASRGSRRIRRATRKRDCGRSWVIRIRVKITVVSQVEKITGQYHVQPLV